MPPSDQTTAPPDTAKTPRCAMCRARMTLVSREPQANGAEKHHFKCPKCEFAKTKTFGDPSVDARHRPPRKKAPRRA